MFLKLFKGCPRMLTKNLHTEKCLNVLFDKRRIIEDEWRKNHTEWNDDEDEQRRMFHDEEKRRVPNNKQQLKCEFTGKPKNQGDCECKDVCIAKQSETYLIHYEGGFGTISKK